MAAFRGPVLCSLTAGLAQNSPEEFHHSQPAYLLCIDFNNLEGAILASAAGIT